MHYIRRYSENNMIKYQIFKKKLKKKKNLIMNNNNNSYKVQK